MRFLRSHRTHGAIFGGSLNPRFMGTWCEGRVSPLSAFWGLQNTILVTSFLAFCRPENANFAGS